MWYGITRFKAKCFKQQLRAEIFKVVHSFKLQTFAETLDRVLWVEPDNVLAREKDKSFDKEKKMKKN